MTFGFSRRELLAAYDAALRGRAEMGGASSWDRSGPLWRGVSHRGGFVSYESLDGVADVDALIAQTIEYFIVLPGIEEFEWKTRGHDRPVDLGRRLQAQGLVPEEVETVMIGEAARLAQDVEVPAGIVVHRVDQLADREDVIRQAAAMQREVFGSGPSTAEVIDRLDRQQGLEEFWVALARDEVVSAGRLTRVPDSAFAGLWGGATRPEWRGRGAYRAVTAARARSAIDGGVTYLHSDCTAMSQPILERSGLTAVTTTTPYIWRQKTPQPRVTTQSGRA
ncbi:MAG: GNAT family N-acetyltransferase [Acidimicrobiales bacterium]